MVEAKKEYLIEEHRFRFAAWAASTAASASAKCRFSVEVGRKILEDSGCEEYANGWDKLPEADAFDEFHTKQCKLILIKSSDFKANFSGKFSYGVSAKLFNCYLKTLFLGGINADLTYEQIRKQDAIHPPIDRVLLNGLAVSAQKEKVTAEAKMWRAHRDAAWSTYNYTQYKAVIKDIRKCFPGAPLWKVEAYWKGHQ